MKIRQKLFLAMSLCIAATIIIFSFIIVKMERNDIILQTCSDQKEYFKFLREQIEDLISDSQLDDTKDKETVFEADMITKMQGFAREYSYSSGEQFLNGKNLRFALYSLRDKRYWFNNCGYNPDSVLASSEEIQEVIVHDGGRVYLFTGVSDSFGYDLMIYMMSDITENYNRPEKARYVILVIGALLCLFMIVVTYIVTKGTFHSLKLLEKNISEIGNGAYGKCIEVHGKDEISSIIRCFNQMSQKIEENMENIQQEIENRELLINTLSHEIKTPITSIKGCSQTLLLTKLSKEQQEDILYMMDKEATRMERLSQKMMQLIAMEQIDKSSFTEIEIAPMLELLKTTMEKNYENKHIKIEVKSNKTFLTVDEDLFFEMLSNFVDNAAKACGEDGRIEIQIEDNRLVVSDNGRGMEKEHLEKIFLPFYMIDKARSRKNNGVGLGLSICQKIMEVHDYSFDIESVVGKGTKITIYNLLTKA